MQQLDHETWNVFFFDSLLWFFLFCDFFNNRIEFRKWLIKWVTFIYRHVSIMYDNDNWLRTAHHHFLFNFKTSIIFIRHKKTCNMFFVFFVTSRSLVQLPIIIILTVFSNFFRLKTWRYFFPLHMYVIEHFNRSFFYVHTNKNV